MARPSHPAHCTIIPPYILEAMAASAEPAVADHAREALRHDERVRRQRRQQPSAREADQPRVWPRPRPSDGIEPGPAAPGTPTPPAAGAGPQRTIADAGGRTTTPGRQVRTEGEPATGDAATDEAYEGLGATWELYWTAYGRDSLDGKGLPLLATVHYGNNYDNAFWDGSQMVFGDGDGVIFERFTRSLDVIGHELTHGVTQFTAGLTYQGQSGALNESISDVFGVLVKQRALGQKASEADWLIGAELLAAGVKGRALRDMRNPGTAYDDPRLGTDPQPADMSGYVTTSDDNGGVHINSGIPNRAFALAALAVDGFAWETIGPTWFAVLDGPGIKADCDFATFADLTVAAAAQLHGDGSAEHSAVRSGWEQVGVLAPAGDTGGAGAGDGAGAGQGPRHGAGHGAGGGKGGGRRGHGHRDREPAPAPGTETPSGPAHGEVPGVDAEVLLRRTGGLVGRVVERRMALGELSEGDTRDWQHLLAAPTLQRIAATTEGSHPDAFSYSVVCDEVGCDVTIAEPHLPEAIHSLFERTLRQG